MAYRRLYIMRKDLHMSPGKLSAMIAHCSEAYWTTLLSNGEIKREYYEDNSVDCVTIKVDSDIMDEYVKGSFVKTLCEAKNLKHLLKVRLIAEDLHLVEGKDFGFINDSCLTELTPENEDGTCTVGVWFRPLPDEISHILSKKYQLYKN